MQFWFINICPNKKGFFSNVLMVMYFLFLPHVEGALLLSKNYFTSGLLNEQTFFWSSGYCLSCLLHCIPGKVRTSPHGHWYVKLFMKNEFAFFLSFMLFRNSFMICFNSSVSCVSENSFFQNFFYFLLFLCIYKCVPESPH